ncbi:MAG: DMT family transporter [Gammaproteobacteria bacterium]|nr:DMT family transporter [Gammaproteobacteria bacterium]
MGWGLGAGALWGMVFLAPALLAAFSPLQLTVGRYLAYGAVALLLPLHRLLFAVSGRDWLRLLALSLLGNLLYFVLLAQAVQWVGIAPSSLIVGLIPVVVMVAGSREQGTPPARRLIGPLLLMVVGTAAIALDSYQAGAGSGLRPGWQSWAGLVCAFGALLSWAAYAVANRHWLRQRPGYSSQHWSLLTGVATGALALLLAPLAFADLSGAESGQSWPLFWLVMVAVAIGASVVGNALWNGASRRLPLTLTGQLILFETLFALLYGFMFDGRWPRPLEWLAMVLMIGGVFWTLRLFRQLRP